MAADINQIAKACNVSKATVSRVFTQKPGVSAQVRQRILDVARKMNYSPKQVVAQDTVAVVVTDYNVFYNPGRFQAHLISAVLAQLARSGYSIKIIEMQDIELLAPSYVKAAVVYVDDSRIEGVNGRLQSLNIPVITNNMLAAGAFSVCDDARLGAEMALRHFFANGHEKIAMILDSSGSWASTKRVAGYRATLEQCGLDYNPELVYAKDNSMLVEVLAGVRRSGATAVFLAGEGIVEEAVYMLRILDVQIPRQLSMISCEKFPSSRWFTPPHTTVSQELEAIALETVKIISAILSGEVTKPFTVTLPPKLIERESVLNLQGRG